MSTVVEASLASRVGRKLSWSVESCRVTQVAGASAFPLLPWPLGLSFCVPRTEASLLCPVGSSV